MSSDAQQPRKLGADGRWTAALPAGAMSAFIAAVVLIVTIAVLSWISLGSRKRSTDLVVHTLEARAAVADVLSILKDAETGQRGYLLTGDSVFLEPYHAAMTALPGQLAALRRTLSDNRAQIDRLDTLERVAEGRLAIIKETLELKAAGDHTGAVSRMQRGRQMMLQLRELVAGMMEAERRLLDERTEEMARAQLVSTEITLGGSAVLLLLTIVAAVMFSRDHRDRETERWLREGQGGLALEVQGEQTLEAVGQRIVSFVALYTHAQVGALYVAGATGDLRRVGAYAVPPGEPNARDPGGLSVQALRDNRLLALADVPADYFPVTSGLGEARPRHLFVAPTHVDGACNGVLELGHLDTVFPPYAELLRRVAEPIGVALRTARLRDELQRLLEETQRQAEELQTQQEELRVQNEELEQQTRALQDSQARLENQQAELEQINSQLEEQTQLLARQRDDLARAQGELVRANTYKSEFLANMSHELRTPLNSSLILAKLLADNRSGNLDEEQVKFARTIYGAGNDLLTLINDILDLSKIEAGKLDVRAESVPIARIVDDVRSTFEPVAKDKRLALALHVDPSAPGALSTDPMRLQQVLKNLLSNALKFTERGEVRLDVRGLPDGRIAFAVHDTGIGIAPAQHEVIFEAFRQADGTTNRKHGGTGLGLSISRDLARLLGGELVVESAEGKGSTFTLTLPPRMPEPAERPAPAPPPRPRRVTSAAAPVPVRDSRPARAAAPTDDDRDRLRSGGRVLLVVEDDAAFAAVLRDLARELDFDALVAGSGEEGLALARAHRPSAILLDVGLPDRSGLSVLDALKHDAATRHIPVHVISGEDHTQAALEMGAAGYALKPIAREQLVEAFRKLEARLTQKVRRVLVVEDDPTLRDATCRLLGGGDVECMSTGTAADALRLLREGTFDCMVLDLTLPDRSGLELLEEMSGGDQYSVPPVIVYTGQPLSAEAEQRLRRFSQSIIVKGARSPERLLDEVTLFLHQVEAELPPDRQRMLRDARHREAVFEGRRVLVVEDDVRNIFALSSVLEPKGATVEIARNGREALEHLKAKPGVDLVLMDIMMPEMDGLEATREIRKMPGLDRLPIIALTAKAMADDRDACLQAGASDYIAKPLDVDKLLSLARVWMPK